MPPLGSEPGLTSTRDTAFSLGSQPSEPLWGSFSIPPASKNVVTSPANAAASSIPTIPPISTTASTAGPSALSPSPSSTTRSKPPTPTLTIPNSTLSLFPHPHQFSRHSNPQQSQSR
ncbi:hypothetical protein D9757_012909 [Collybiopsis confluens]|uniref:Uncharacterized protein n=1 Tax=Collybiopsis confluens TaxID=2823264 RepID=A0A8H5D984_9AGAR|nr:hypothetical protein D9757_012909 [Collybiopsis confluens]